MRCPNPVAKRARRTFTGPGLVPCCGVRRNLCPGSAVLLCFSSSDIIPVALSNSEGAGSGAILVVLPGAHLYIQVLGNTCSTVATVHRHPKFPLQFVPSRRCPFLETVGAVRTRQPATLWRRLRQQFGAACGPAPSHTCEAWEAVWQDPGRWRTRSLAGPGVG